MRNGKADEASSQGDLSVGRHWGRFDGCMWLPEVAYRWQPDDFASYIFLIIDFVCPVAFLLLLVLWSHCVTRRSTQLAAAEASAKGITGPIWHEPRFAWWNRLKVSNFIRLLQAPDPVQLVQPEWSSQALRGVLECCGFMLDGWSDAATDDLAEELAGGRSRLSLHDGRPMRHVELIMLVIEHTRGRRILQVVQDEESEQAEKSMSRDSEKSEREDTNAVIGEDDIVDATKEVTEEATTETSKEATKQAVKRVAFPPLPELVPTTRRAHGEHILSAARRCLTQKLGIPQDAVRVHEGLISVADEVQDLDCFPDLRSFVRKFLVHVEVTTLDKKMLQGLDLYSQSAEQQTPRETIKLGKQKYRWTQLNPSVQVSQYFHGSRVLSNRYSSELLMAEPPQSLRTGLLEGGHGGALLPWTQQNIKDLLKAHEVSVEKTEARYGLDLPQLAAELQKGRLAFGVRVSDSRLLCFEDVFSLLITTTTAEVLVELCHEESQKGPGKTHEPVGHLPCAKRLVGEDAWAIARRIACGQLNIMCRDLTITEQLVQEVLPGNVAQHVLGGLWPFCGQSPDFVLREFVVLAHVASPDRVIAACP